MSALKTALAGLLLLITGAASAEAAFDYWMLSLSWSPEYCASRGSMREAQCQRDYPFVVHGLWPQYERGYPKHCDTEQEVSKDLIQRMLALMPSEHLVKHQWRKHGSCSGMNVTEYFLQTERAWRRVVIPPRLQDVDRRLTTNVGELEREFIAVNPGLTPTSVALQCSRQWLREVRICFNRDFEFRECGEDIRDRCGREVRLRPSRTARFPTDVEND